MAEDGCGEVRAPDRLAGLATCRERCVVDAVAGVG
jgi:hypothetical protein